jgi:hypothetical protein
MYSSVLLRNCLSELCGKKTLTTKELKGLHKGYTKFMNY